MAPDHSALRAYFLAAANVWEPGQVAERLAWARTAMLADAVSGYLLQCDASTPATAESRRDRLTSKLEQRDELLVTPGYVLYFFFKSLFIYIYSFYLLLLHC